jgi:hypothetical protein
MGEEGVPQLWGMLGDALKQVEYARNHPLTTAGMAMQIAGAVVAGDRNEAIRRKQDWDFAVEKNYSSVKDENLMAVKQAATGTVNFGVGLAEGVGDVAEGTVDAALHPVDTLVNTAEAIDRLANMTPEEMIKGVNDELKSACDLAKNDPDGFARSAGRRTGQIDAAVAGPKVAKALKEAAEGIGGLRGAHRLTPAELKKARNKYKNNKPAARKGYEQRTGNQWPVDENGNPWPGEHTPPLTEGGDPMTVTPRDPGLPDPHNIPGPDGLTDYQRWGAEGTPAREAK